MSAAMKLADWLKTNKIRQDALGIEVGLTQGRISQIARKGTRDIPTARKIEIATKGEVRVEDLLPDAWRDALRSEESAA